MPAHKSLREILRVMEKVRAKALVSIPSVGGVEGLRIKDRGKRLLPYERRIVIRKARW